MTTKNSKTIESGVVTTTTSEYVKSLEDQDQLQDVVEPKQPIIYPNVITRKNFAERISFNKHNGEKIKGGLCMNPGGPLAQPLRLEDTYIDEDGKRKMRTNLPIGFMNLAGAFANPNGKYFMIVPGATYKVDPETITFATYLDNAIYATGAYLKANGFEGEFSPMRMYAVSIHYGEFLYEEIKVVRYQKERIAELNTTKDGIALAQLEDKHRKMAAKFIAGQEWVDGKERFIFPMFWTKDDADNWERDMDHLQRYLDGFEATFNGDVEALDKGQKLYARQVVNAELRNLQTQEKAGVIVIDSAELKISLKLGDKVEVVPATSLVPGRYDMFAPGAAPRRVVAIDTSWAWAKMAARKNTYLVPVVDEA